MNKTSTFRYSAMLLFSLLITAGAIAQAVIRGTVKNAAGQALSGASVLLLNEKNGTTTNNNGAYVLNVVPGKHTLVFSYVGLAGQRIDVTASASSPLIQDIQLADAGDISEVTVTGSRAPGRTRTETAVPVDVIPLATVINDIGQVDLNQILTFVAPSFQSSRQTISDGTDHVDPAQLRGLGTDQVLVLINGKRRHQSALVNVNGTVNRGQVGTDLSAIPPTSIERIEILRDGAAAQYGSDAIAGVINIILKKNTGVLEGGVSYGANVTEYPKNYALYKLGSKSDDPNVKVTDGNSFQASLGYGFKLGKGSLHLNGEIVDRTRSNRAGTFTGALYPNVNSVNRDDSIMGARGLNRDDFDMLIGNSDMKSSTGFYNFEYPINDKTEIYAFGGYSKKEGKSAGFFRYPSSIASGAGAYASNVFAIYPNGFLPRIESSISDFSTAVGLRTKLGEWNFDLSNTFGVNKFDFGVSNSINYSQFAVAGNNQTRFDAGGLKFYQNTVNLDLSKKYDVLSGLNVATGAEFRLDGFGINSGEEASYKNYNTSAGVAAGAQVFPGFINSIGDTKSRNSKAVYTDLELDVSRKFLVTGALRFENYSDFGSTLNYKLSSRYKLADKFNIRASISSGFRAPSMQQRFYAKTNTLFVTQNGQQVPVESGTFTNDSKAAQILGIPKLQEETSNSYSVGFTSKPFTGFEVTVDAYQINIDNRIVLTNNFSGGNNQQLKDQLAAAGASAANFFTNAIDTKAKGLEAVVSYNKKFAGKHSIRTTLALTFIDNEVVKGGDGLPKIKASPVLVNSGQLGNYFNREDQSRVEVANPQNKTSLTFNYNYSKFGAMVRFVRFGKVTYLDPTMNPANPSAFPVNAFTGQKETLDQEFDSKVVTDLSLSYQLTKALGVTVGANNLFDVYQEMHSHSGNMSSGRFIYSRRVQQMGFSGAYYFGRLRFAINTNK